MTTLKIPVSSNDHHQGNLNGPIVLVEYGDYECPHCLVGYSLVKDLQSHFGEQLCFVFRNFPLVSIHEHAEMAAEAAEFAASKGKFWEMHDAIYENQERLGPELLVELTKTLGLSVKDLQTALENKTFAGKVREDFSGGVRSGVNGTPTFFINGERYNGPLHLQKLIQAIDQSVRLKI